MSLWARQWRGLAALHRAIGHADLPDASAVDLGDDAVQAIVPTIDTYMCNSAALPSLEQLDAHLDGIAERFAPSPRWHLWLPATDATARARLQAFGLQHRADPNAMGAWLRDLDTAYDPAVEQVDPYLVGWLNNKAYDTDYHQRVIGALPRAAIRGYATGDARSGLLIADSGDEASAWFVATAPDHQRQGLATKVLRHALQEARDRGAVSSTLQSNAAGRPVYAALGYQELESLEAWGS